MPWEVPAGIHVTVSSGCYLPHSVFSEQPSRGRGAPLGSQHSGGTPVFPDRRGYLSLQSPSQSYPSSHGA